MSGVCINPEDLKEFNMAFIPDQPILGSFIPDQPLYKGFVPEKKAGFIETITEKPEELLPFISEVRTFNLYGASQRLQQYQKEPDLYEKHAEFMTSYPASVYWTPKSAEQYKTEDIKLLTDYFEKLDREYTLGGRVAQITREMPKFMIEFIATGGAYQLGSSAAKRGATKLLAGAGVRAAALPHRAAAAILQRRLPKGMEVTEAGEIKLTGPKESKWTSAWKGLADHYIEVASEQVGEFIQPQISKVFRKLPLIGKFTNALEKAWLGKFPEKTKAEFAKKLFSKAGFHGILSEMGEEDIAWISKGILNIEDFGAGADSTIPQRLSAGFKADIQNIIPEAISFAIPGGAKQVVSGIRTEAEKTLESRLRFKPEIKTKIVDTIKSSEAIKLRSAVEPEIKLEHGKRGGEYTDMLQRLTDEGVNPVQAHHIAESTLKGQYPGTEIDFVALKEKLSDIEMNEVFSSIIYDERLLPFQRTNLMEAWEKVAIKGQLPTPSEIKLISEFIDPDIAETLSAQRTWGRKVYQGVLNVLSFPKAVMASYDVSGPGRQGIVLAPLAGRKIYLQSIVDGVKALGSEGAAQTIMQNIETNPMYGLLKASGIELTDWRGPKTRYGQYEERFQSEFAQNLPGIRASERAYVASLNKLRADTFYKFAEQWHGQNVLMKEYKDLAKFINHATGRGDIPKYMRGFANIANATFFSPRLLISRFQTIYDLINPNMSQRVRKLAAADLVEFVGAGLLALWLLSLIPGIEINKDPRNSDFGKIRYGDTRIDFWAGYSQIARLTAQMILNEQKSLSSGRMFKPGRAEIFTRFLESKLNPAVGAALDIYRGQTFFGEEIKPEAPFVAEQIWQRITPLFIQDVVDAVRFQGLGTAGIVAPLAFFGIGAMTYPESTSGQSFRLKDHYARKVFGKKWDEIGNESQEALRINYPQIKEFENQVRFERENWDFISKIQEETSDIGEKIQKSLSENVRTEFNSIGFKIPGLSRYIGRSWYLNDKRYNQYKESVQKDIQKVLPKIISSNVYKSMSDSSKRDFLNTIIQHIKKIRRQEIKDSALKNDLVNLMEIKNAAGRQR